MANKTPLQQVNELHQGKEKLVDKLMGMLDRGELSKDEFRSRLLAAPNSKLLRLHDVTTRINEQFGNAEKLVDAILGLMNRAKDQDYREKLLTYSPNRLMDLHRSWQKKTNKKAS
jgi:hypothetical protein